MGKAEKETKKESEGKVVLSEVLTPGTHPEGEELKQLVAGKDRIKWRDHKQPLSKLTSGPARRSA